MGYQTYVSMLKYFPSGKLPFSDIYIASRKQTHIKNAFIISDVKAFLEDFDEDLMVIGGAQIYKIALDYADELRITYVLKPYEGDTYFPKYSLDSYKLVHYNIQPELILTHYERVKK
jgi:dihydrofolate reductase